MNEPLNVKDGARVRCSVGLGGNIRKSCDDPRRSWDAFGNVNHSENYLREVYHYPGHVAVITDAAKKKGMRFDVSSFKDGEIAHTQDNIMVLRGGAAEFLDRLFECGPCRVSRKQSALLFLRRHVTLLASACYQRFNLLCGKFSYAHKRVFPSNEKAHLPEPGEKVERKGDKQNE